MSDKNRKKVTTYLVDSENVNDVWIPLATAMETQDQMLVFYTEKSPHMSYEKVIEITRLPAHAVQWMKCVEGNNALDFQLVTELGARIALAGDGTFVIISNDTGFDAAVKYWIERGKDVRRIKSAECRNLAQTLQAERRAAEETDVQVAAGEETLSELEEVQTDALCAEQESFSLNYIRDIEQLCKSIPLSRMTMLRNAFVCIYGQKTAGYIYAYMKEHHTEFERVSKQYLKERKARLKNYISFVLAHEMIKTEDSEKIAELYQRVDNPKKNLQELHVGMTKSFGNEYGPVYYRLLKKHLDVLMKL